MNRLFKKVISIILVSIMLLSTACINEGNIDNDETSVTLDESTKVTTTEKVETTAVTTPVVTEKEQIEIPISSTFYSDRVLDTIEKNSTEILEFKAMKQIAVNGAKKYLDMSYEELWSLIFGPELDRSWMVLSDGICPSCKESVIMYNWKIDPNVNPWKLQCPKCNELFPKNDFEAYYKSGLDNSGRFSQDRADKSLLYNMETGDKNDKFGVDDGTGFVQDGETFRFIQTYLVYGQWKKMILDAIERLSDAYIFTRDTEYAKRALILLDRLADFWPEYDYIEQGWLYEQIGTCEGYISYRIDSAFECYSLAMAYDKVVEVLYMEPEICDFLSEKAKITGIDNKKVKPEDVKENIDERILKHIVNNQPRLLSNPPYTELAVMACLGALNWEQNHKMLEDQIAEIIANNTKYDGMTGESGLTGYATMGKSAIAKMCNLFTLADPDFIEKMYEKVPKLYDAYRFHIDLHCVNRYYPLLGDVGYFGQAGTIYPSSAGEENLMLYKLYEITGDEDLLRALFQSNGSKVTGAFKKFVEIDDIKEKYNTINKVIKENSKIELDSVKKDEYQISVLRTGDDMDKTEVWINFGTNKTSHSHGDGMNIGIYYQDADLMPDNGYPNVSYGGGWNSDVVRWFTGTISHNVISFNKQRQSRTNGTVDLWSMGDVFKVMRANAPGMFKDVKKYERSLALTDINGSNAYIVDVFRVGNGPAGSYEKYMRSNISKLETTGLELAPTQREYPAAVYLSNFQESTKTDEAWTADWFISNYFNVFSYAYALHLKMIDLTRNENVLTCDTWLPPSMALKDQGDEGFQLPTVITERTVEQGEVATFVSILEPYSRESKVTAAKRLPCVSVTDNTDYDSNVAVEVKTFNEFTDVVILLDKDVGQDKLDVKVETDRGTIETNAQSCLLRYDKDGNLILIRASMGDYVKTAGNEYKVTNSDEVTVYDLIK